MTARPKRRRERDDDRASTDADDAEDTARPDDRAGRHRSTRRCAVVGDPAYVLCEHGYLRRGWCDECER